jgi:hypothetical protein
MLDHIANMGATGPRHRPRPRAPQPRNIDDLAASTDACPASAGPWFLSVVRRRSVTGVGPRAASGLGQIIQEQEERQQDSIRSIEQDRDNDLQFGIE